jgi:hypothetical protein
MENVTRSRRRVMKGSATTNHAKIDRARPIAISPAEHASASRRRRLPAADGQRHRVILERELLA